MRFVEHRQLLLVVIVLKVIAAVGQAFRLPGRPFSTDAMNMLDFITYLIVATYIVQTLGSSKCLITVLAHGLCIPIWRTFGADSF